MLILMLFSESLAKFPRRTSASSGFHNQAQQSDEQMQQQQQQQQTVGQNSNDASSVQANMQLAGSNGPSGMASVNNVNTASTSTSASTIVGLLHQNSMNSRQQSSMNNANSPYGGSSVQIPPSPGSSSTIPQTQANPSPFQSPTPSSNNPSQTSHGALTATNHMSAANSPANVSMQQPALSGEADPSDSQSSVQKIIHDMMMSNQLNGSGSMVGVGSLGNDVKNINGILSSTNNPGMNGLSGNGMGNSNSSMGGGGFGSMGGLGQPAMVNGIRSTMGNNSVMNGRVGMASMAREQSMHHQQDIGSQLLSGLGAVNGYNNNLQFDWKHSP